MRLSTDSPYHLNNVNHPAGNLMDFIHSGEMNPQKPVRETLWYRMFVADPKNSEKPTQHAGYAARI
jgi:hypothetical protein